jgi:protein gp37
MSDKSAIEWTDATWNPVTGCTKISPGCKHCYAERFAERFRGVPGHPFEQGFDLRLWANRLELPLRWKEPRRIFVNSTSDLFHRDVPGEFIDRIFDVMVQARQHIFQVLTKRSDRLKGWATARYGSGEDGSGRRWPLNVWAGVSVETQQYLARVRDLQCVPADIRFLSVEPLLGPIEFEAKTLRGIHWVIVGGESGPGARPMQLEWVRAIRRHCVKHRVQFFFKQWGAFTPDGRRVGKKVAGRILDGRTWDDVPTQRDGALTVAEHR